MEKYEYVERLGEGAYGSVWKCRERETGRLVAIKRFKDAHIDPEVMRLALREVRHLKACRHRNIVQLIEAFRSSSGRVYIVMEYVERTVTHDLHAYRQGLPAAHVKLITWQLLQSLVHMHKLKICHRDIKPANILISDQGVLKLCDFGFARNMLSRKEEQYSNYVVTRWYRPPEVIVGGKYNNSVDIWAVGCIFAELATGKAIFPGKDNLDQMMLILKCFGGLTENQEYLAAQDAKLGAAFRVPCQDELKTLEDRYPHFTPDMMELLKACLQLEPSRRPTARQLLQFNYFDDIYDLIKDTVLDDSTYIKGEEGLPAELISPRTSSSSSSSPSSHCSVISPASTDTQSLRSTNGGHTASMVSTHVELHHADKLPPFSQHDVGYPEKHVGGSQADVQYTSSTRSSGAGYTTYAHSSGTGQVPADSFSALPQRSNHIDSRHPSQRQLTEESNRTSSTGCQPHNPPVSGSRRITDSDGYQDANHTTLPPLLSGIVGGIPVKKTMSRAVSFKDSAQQPGWERPPIVKTHSMQVKPNAPEQRSTYSACRQSAPETSLLDPATSNNVLLQANMLMVKSLTCDGTQQNNDNVSHREGSIPGSMSSVNQSEPAQHVVAAKRSSTSNLSEQSPCDVETKIPGRLSDPQCASANQRLPAIGKDPVARVLSQQRLPSTAAELPNVAATDADSSYSLDHSLTRGPSHAGQQEGHQEGLQLPELGPANQLHTQKRALCFSHTQLSTIVDSPVCAGRQASLHLERSDGSVHVRAVGIVDSPEQCDLVAVTHSSKLSLIGRAVRSLEKIVTRPFSGRVQDSIKRTASEGGKKKLHPAQQLQAEHHAVTTL